VSWIRIDTPEGEREVRPTKTYPRCSHRSAKNPLPCPSPSCAAGVARRRKAVSVEFVDSEGKEGLFVMVRKFVPETGEWKWVSAL
jgi:hypothetical protein